MIPVIRKLVIVFVARTTPVCRAGIFNMALFPAVIAVKFLFAYVSCVAIFPAKFALTFSSICSGPLDLIHRTLCGSTSGSVETGLWVRKAGLQRMPYLSTESEGPAPF